MKNRQVHIIGAGVAGLSAAVRLCHSGERVQLYEAASHAGGRCRSFDDQTLGRHVDNGNHLVLSGNREIMSYLDIVGARDQLLTPSEADIPFFNVRNKEKWKLRPNQGPVPFWIFRKQQRAPGTSAWDYLSGVRMSLASGTRTVSDYLNPSRPAYENFWLPLCLATLNTHPDEAAASLLWPVLRETFLRGGAHCRPMMIRNSLNRTFIDPALDFIGRKGGTISFNRRLKAVSSVDERIVSFDFKGETVRLAPDDQVILAVPPETIREVLPEIMVPQENRPIVNAHFQLRRPVGQPLVMGLVGSRSHWLFVRGDVASVTVSGATALVDLGAEEIARVLWPEIALALELSPDPVPAYRIVKEKRATFAQTIEQVRRRPTTGTQLKNLFLAGDWISTGLPATLEGATLSGRLAVDAIHKQWA